MALHVIGSRLLVMTPQLRSHADSHGAEKGAEDPHLSL